MPTYLSHKQRLRHCIRTSRRFAQSTRQDSVRRLAMAARTASRTLKLPRLALLTGMVALSACAALGDSPRSRSAARVQTKTQATPAQAPEATPNTNAPAQSPAESQAQSQAQSGSDTPQSANGRARFQVDRRPVKAINTFNGNHGHPYSLHPQWGSDDVTAMAWLEKQLNMSYANGYRRFVLILPGGRDRDTHLMSGSHWYPMSLQRRARLAEFFPRWIAEHPGVSLGLYTGFDIDPDPTTTEYANHYLAYFDNKAQRDRLWAQMAPWFEICGFTEIWWDYASPPGRRDEAVKFSQWLAEKGIKGGGEAMPRVLPDYDGNLDQEYMTAMPWMALPKYFRVHDSAKKWRVDPETTEAFFAMRGGDEVTDEELYSVFERGFIPWVYSTNMDERVMRIWNQVNSAIMQSQQSQASAPAAAPKPTPAPAPAFKTVMPSGRRHR